MKNKNEILGAKLFSSIFGEAFNEVFDTLKDVDVKKIKKKSYIFVVSPNGVTEINNPNDYQNTPKKQETEICQHCAGDGYLHCEACNGDGFIIHRKGLGQTNEIETCEDCDGKGDVLCPICKGTGEINGKKDIPDKNEFTPDEINEEIEFIFLEHKHKTIIGDVYLGINKIEHKDNGIYVIPDINTNTLLPDVTIDDCFSKIKKELDTLPIEIPQAFFYQAK